MIWGCQFESPLLKERKSVQNQLLGQYCTLISNSHFASFLSLSLFLVLLFSFSVFFFFFFLFLENKSFLSHVSPNPEFIATDPENLSGTG